MSCAKDIAKNITSNCDTQPVAGVEVKAWIGQRRFITPTYDVTNPSLVTGLAVETGQQLFTLTAVKQLLNPAYERIVAQNRADTFKHKFSFEGFEFESSDVENLDSLDDLVVVVEMINKVTSADGTFRIFGLTRGLYPTTDTWTANDIDGARAITMESLDGQTEKYSQNNFLVSTGATAYADTLAALVALEAVQI